MAGLLSGMWQELWKNAGGASMAHALATQPTKPRNCKVQTVELGFMHCCSFSAGRTEEISVLLVTGVRAGRQGIRWLQARRRCTASWQGFAREACTLAHLHTDSGSRDACWNPCAGIRWNLYQRTCVYDHRGCISVIFNFID